MQRDKDNVKHKKNWLDNKQDYNNKNNKDKCKKIKEEINRKKNN